MDTRQYAPATERNRGAILEVLKKMISPQSKSNILEIASGTGEHAVFLSTYFKSCYWIPSDINPVARESIIAWKNHAGLENLALPLTIDVTKDNWSDRLQDREIDAIVNINMIHISPWDACVGLIKGASKILSTGGILYLYGPYKRNGKHTAPSNASFDLSLRERNSSWGVREIEAVTDLASQANLRLQEVIEMPANNLSVIFIKD